MVGQPVDLGPFVGGLNNRTDDSTIDDTDLVAATNWIVGIDGTLIGRQPITEYTKPGSFPSTTARLKLLGYTVMHAAGVFTPVLFASNANGTWAFYSGAWDQISNKEYDCFVTYGNTTNKAFFAKKGSDNGGSWLLTDANIVTYTDMPIGWTMAVHKNRIWVAGNLAEPSRLKFSIPTPNGDNDDWEMDASVTPLIPPAGYIDVNPGDGQRINYIMSYEDNLVIFKDDSTWILAYDAVISQGQLISVSDSIGASDPNCVAIYDGVAYVYHEGNVYAFAQGQFQSITEKFLPVGNSSVASAYSTPLCLSVFGDNLILRQYDKVYVYHLLTGSWTEWVSEHPISKFVLVPTNIGLENNTYFIQSAVTATDKIFQIKTVWDNTATENFTCSVTTKTYDFGTARNFKRLFWWGIDCESGSGAVTAWVTPFNNRFQERWEDLTGLWEDYELRTWEAILTDQPSIEDGPTTNSSRKRRFYKCLKSLRFHQINFKVSITTDGTEANGRVKLFAIVPFVNIKQGVVAKIT
jgi:hypothetical protein